MDMRQSIPQTRPSTNLDMDVFAALPPLGITSGALKLTAFLPYYEFFYARGLMYYYSCQKWFQVNSVSRFYVRRSR